MIENLDIGIDSQDIVSYEWTAMLTEFKLSINEYLVDFSYSPVHSLADIIAFNKAHPIEASILKKKTHSSFHLFSPVIDSNSVESCCRGHQAIKF